MEMAQFNIAIPEDEFHQIKIDTAEMNTSLKLYVRVACRHFRKSLSIDQRRVLFADRESKKRVGRPVVSN